MQPYVPAQLSMQSAKLSVGMFVRFVASLAL
jgi:hypothetical protein